MGLRIQLGPVLFCILFVLLKANEIHFMRDLSQNSRKGLVRDEGEMVYCYLTRNARTTSKIYATPHTRHHFLADMKHSSFVATAQIKLKEIKGLAQFVLFSAERRLEKKKLFIWWLNVARRQVGITYNGRNGRTSLLYFAKVPFEVGTWFQLTLRFRRSRKTNPLVDLYVNNNHVETKILNGDFKETIVRTREGNIVITMADMFGIITATSVPKICMRRLTFYTDKNIDDIVNACPKQGITKEDLLQLEQRITAKVAASYNETITKMMEEMKSLLDTCGVCQRPPIAVKRPPPVLVKRPPPKAVGPKVARPVENKPKQVLKSLQPEEPCPPGLNACHSNAECTPNVLASGNYCKCNLGFAGNGYTCGKDSDLDGFPDEDLPNCKEKTCKKDNCLNKPNSGQENNDGDRYGDACDEDQDNDGLSNKRDNCPFHYNPNQMDKDGDMIGDACDNCLETRNRDQKDTDKNGKGDACSEDIDDDGVVKRDNCPYKKNPGQEDYDRDGIGDVCDNCPKVANRGQEDVDQDLVGDACDSNIDRDKDGTNDRDDNCVNVVNPGQLDTDGDGLGDECDPDDDNDGVPDEKDNCRLTPNKDQKVDPNSLKYGIACQDDYDGDAIANNLDSCPENKEYSAVSLDQYQTINLDPKEEEQRDPVWRILNQGREILQVENSDPGMAIGLQSFRGVDYYGTIFVDTEADNDYFGLVFGYQSSSKFYTIMWKKVGQVYWDKEPFEAHGRTGLSVKVVDSVTGPGPVLRNALWNTNSTKDQVRTLWHDPKHVGWTSKTAYHWELKHRPTTGYMRLRMFDGEKDVIDTGAIYDKTYSGGRLGVMSFSQEKVSWSKIFYRCNDAPEKK